MAFVVGVPMFSAVWLPRGPGPSRPAAFRHAAGEVERPRLRPVAGPAFHRLNPPSVAPLPPEQPPVRGPLRPAVMASAEALARMLLCTTIDNVLGGPGAALHKRLAAELLHDYLRCRAGTGCFAALCSSARLWRPQGRTTPTGHDEAHSDPVRRRSSRQPARIHPRRRRPDLSCRAARLGRRHARPGCPGGRRAEPCQVRAGRLLTTPPQPRRPSAPSPLRSPLHVPVRARNTRRAAGRPGAPTCRTAPRGRASGRHPSGE